MKYKVNPKPKKRVKLSIPTPVEEPSIVDDVRNYLQGELDTLRTEMLTEIESIELPEPEHGEDGIDGEDAELPTEDELLDLIRPLIPEPIKGDKGDQGESIVGPKGEKGDQGLSIKGEKGDKGDPGKDGKDAKQVDIKPFIADVVEKFDKKLKALDARLTAEMRHLQSKTMTGGGGGLGTIKYFKFTCDDVTIAFTLPDTPTQEGNAVFPRYQGQSLYPTDHFTVSGRTITTTFTGETGSFIDGFLIT